MKKLILFIAAILLINIGVFSQNLQRYYEVKNYIENLGYRVNDNNIWYKNLAEKEFFYNYKTYYYGTDYILVAFSEDLDVQDIDLWLCETDEDTFKKDTDIENTAVLYFSPAENYYMKTYVKNYRSNDPLYASRCWLIVGYK